MQFELADPWIFFALPLPLAAWLLLPPFRKRRSALIVPFFGKATGISGQKPRSSAWISHRSIFAWILLSLCWICLLSAAASPQQVGKPAKKIRTVRSFLIVADLSFSMAQTDWVLDGRPTSRWEAVRTILKQFVKRRKSDQVGLVLFATHPYLQAPLTTDLDAITWLLDETEIGMAGQFTSIGEAIAFGSNILKKDTLKQKVMLLLTDGIDEGKSVNPMDAARLAATDSITIYTLGIGKAKGSGGYDLDERSLKDIAAATHGRYFNAMNESQLKAADRELDAIEPVKYEEESFSPVRLLYPYPLAAAILLALAFQLLNTVIRLATNHS
jgi:Ca-activated chloride channel family protein